MWSHNLLPDLIETDVLSAFNPNSNWIWFEWKKKEKVKISFIQHESQISRIENWRAAVQSRRTDQKERNTIVLCNIEWYVHSLYSRELTLNIDKFLFYASRMRKCCWIKSDVAWRVGLNHLGPDQPLRTAINVFVLIAYNRNTTRANDTWFLQIAARDYFAPQPPPETDTDYPACTVLYETPISDLLSQSR